MALKETPVVKGLQTLLQRSGVVRALGVASVLLAGYVAFKMPAAAGIGFRVRTGVLVAAYVLASVLVARIVILVVLAYLPPRSNADLDLPLGPTRKLSGRLAWLLPVGAFAILTAMREGLVEPASFDFWLSSDTVSQRWNSRHSYSFTTANAERRWLRALPVACSRGYNVRSSDIARGFDRFVHCPANTSSADAVNVSFSLQAPDAFCHLPLYRWATVRFSVHMGVNSHWRDAGGGMGNGGGIVDVDGTVDVSSVGLMSCRRFNEVIGERIGQISVDRVNEFLRNN